MSAIIESMGQKKAQGGCRCSLWRAMDFAYTQMVSKTHFNNISTLEKLAVEILRSFNQANRLR